MGSLHCAASQPRLSGWLRHRHAPAIGPDLGVNHVLSLGFGFPRPDWADPRRVRGPGARRPAIELHVFGIRSPFYRACWPKATVGCSARDLFELTALTDSALHPPEQACVFWPDRRVWFQMARRTLSSALVAHWTTRNGSRQMLALGQCCSTGPDPLGAIAADVGELRAALLAELREELSTTFLLRPSVAQTSRPVT
jgi:hypothetical protein